MTIKRQIVVVAWEDAWKAATADITEDNIDAWHGAVPTQTIGWVVKHDNKGITIANERSVNSAGKEEWRGATFIPAKMILSINPFNLTSPRKKHETPPTVGVAGEPPA